MPYDMYVHASHEHDAQPVKKSCLDELTAILKAHPDTFYSLRCSLLEFQNVQTIIFLILLDLINCLYT